MLYVPKNLRHRRVVNSCRIRCRRCTHTRVYHANRLTESKGNDENHGKSSTHTGQGRGPRVVSAAGIDRMMIRTPSYVMHTILYVDLRCHRFPNKRNKYTISYKTYDVVCPQLRPMTSYTIMDDAQHCPGHMAQRCPVCDLN